MLTHPMPAPTPAAFVTVATAPRLHAAPGTVLRDGDRFHVLGLATVEAGPHRTADEAAQFADRIAADPAAYLDVLTAYAVPGIVDHRPTRHADRRPGRTPLDVGPADYRPVLPPSNTRDRERFGRRFDPSRPWSIDVVLHRPDRRAVSPVVAAARSEAVAGVTSALSPSAALAVAAFVNTSGGDELPAAVVAEVRGIFTAAEFADLLGVVARTGGGR